MHLLYLISFVILAFEAWIELSFIENETLLASLTLVLRVYLLAPVPYTELASIPKAWRFCRLHDNTSKRKRAK